MLVVSCHRLAAGSAGASGEILNGFPEIMGEVGIV